MPAKDEEATSLNKASYVPLYLQIQQKLMERIQSGTLAEGDLLESEEQLSRRYRVSRMTARQALGALKEQGYAYSLRGRGTFITRPRMERNLLHLQGFTEQMRQRGMEPGTRVLEQQVVEADDEISSRLQIPYGQKVLRLRRLRLANAIPLALERTHLPLAAFSGLERFDFSEHSLYQVLQEQYGLRVGWADEVIEALPASREEAALLETSVKASLLSITRTVYNSYGTPMEAARTLYRGDRYRASIRVPARTNEE